MNQENMKMTEVGWIPKDWEVKTLDEVGTFSKGRGVSRDQSHSGKLPCVRYGELYTSHENYIRAFYSFISQDVADTAKRLNKGDVLFAASGETKEEIGKTVAFVGTEEAYAGGDIIILSPKIESNSMFLGFVLNGEGAVRQKSALGQGDAVVHIHAPELARVCIPFPPTQEQSRIAEVLSDTDSLIASLSRNIEKKRLMKQGVMQQLLTGKTRLKGFYGNWVEKTIGGIGDTYNGITGKTKADFGIGNSRYITFLNVLNNPIIDTSILERVNIEWGEGQNEVRKGDLFFNTSSETPEEVGICATLKHDLKDVYLNSFCFGFRITDDEVDNEYLAYYFRGSEGRYLMTTLAQGATRYNLSKDNFNKSVITLPPTKKEQQAIANILTTMDDEIAALEAERDKYISIKQGMMLKLLTGEIRLPICQTTE